MEIQKGFVCQGRDIVRRAARLVRIAGVREQHVPRIAIQDALRGGKRALHLIIHHAVVRHRAVLGLQLIVPALLQKDLFFLIDSRVQHRVHVDIHQVLEVFVIAARHGVHGLIRIRHGI